MLSTTVLVAILIGVAIAQQQQFQDVGVSSRFTQATTPRTQVPIIRHINRVNQDGSYTFGYESGDGTFRVETRGLDGVIKGKYGYTDDLGQRKEVDYLAGSATGYEPSGQGITVPPRPPPPPPGQEFSDYDDGSWRQTSTPRTRQRVRVQQQQHQQQQQQQQPQSSFVHQIQPAPQPQPVQQQIHHQVDVPVRPSVISRPLIQQQQLEPQFHSAFPAPIASSPFASASPSFRSAPVRQQQHHQQHQQVAAGGSVIDQFLSQHLHQGASGQQGFRQFS